MSFFKKKKPEETNSNPTWDDGIVDKISNMSKFENSGLNDFNFIPEPVRYFQKNAKTGEMRSFAFFNHLFKEQNFKCDICLPKDPKKIWTYDNGKQCDVWAFLWPEFEVFFYYAAVIEALKAHIIAENENYILIPNLTTKEWSGILTPIITPENAWRM